MLTLAKISRVAVVRRLRHEQVPVVLSHQRTIIPANASDCVSMVTGHQEVSSCSRLSMRPTVKAGDGHKVLNHEGKVFISCRGLCSDSERDDTDIDYNEMTSLVNGGKGHVIDVREVEEIEADGGVPGAINIPMSELVEALEMPPHKFRALYHIEQPDPEDSDLIFICSKGIRSNIAVNAAKELGYQRSWHFGKGFSYWKECSEREGT